MRALKLFLTAALLSGCGGPADPAVAPGPVPGLHILNATSSLLDIAIDGQTVLAGLSPSAASASLSAAAGTRLVRITPTPGAAVQFTVTLAPDKFTNAVAYQGATGITASVLLDTGAFVPAGKSKVRVLHLAQNKPAMDIWRTQPDFQTPIRFQFPFNYSPEPGPYFQSDSGTWKVWITLASSDFASATKLDSATFNVPDAQKRTVAVVDSAGKLRLRVLVD